MSEQLTKEQYEDRQAAVVVAIYALVLTFSMAGRTQVSLADLIQYAKNLEETSYEEALSLAKEEDQ